ncbi:MAG: DUF72 domain-containing protein [Candidatus Hodarchaeota archaeon]
MDLRIGAGGWAYFKVPGTDSLVAYSRAFDFVEVNSTFYQIPKMETVKSWRRRVPQDFEFSVRCHKSITHKHFLEPTPEVLETFDIMIEICHILRSEFLHILTPPKMEFNHEKIRSIRSLFSTIDLRGVRLVWEVRSQRKELSGEVVKIMGDYNIVHCVDLSTQTPQVESDVLYTRIFGKSHHNVYQFTDDELAEIYGKAKDSNAKKGRKAIHAARMYKDAARLKIFHLTGKFPRVTKNLGVLSLKEVLMEDTEFPITKEELIEKQGWKVIDLTETERVHTSFLLEKLPRKTYKRVGEIIKELQKR